MNKENSEEVKQFIKQADAVKSQLAQVDGQIKLEAMKYAVSTIIAAVNGKGLKDLNSDISSCLESLRLTYDTAIRDMLYGKNR